MVKSYPLLLFLYYFYYFIIFIIILRIISLRIIIIFLLELNRHNPCKGGGWKQTAISFSPNQTQP